MDEQFVDEGFTVPGFYAKSMGDAITTFGSVEIIPMFEVPSETMQRLARRLRYYTGSAVQWDLVPSNSSKPLTSYRFKLKEQKQ